MADDAVEPETVAEPIAPPPVITAREVDPDEQERALGRTIAIAIPTLTVAAAIGTAVFVSAGPAILVLAGGTLLGTITLLWASIRTLGGDAPLPSELEELAGRSMAPSDLVSRKATILRALKDLEHEREIGKLDDADFEEVAARYRDEAKSILRTLDGEVAPKLARAEQIAFEHLKRKGLIDGIAAEPVADEPAAASKDSEKALVVPVVPAQDASATKSARVECAKCATSNEPDATFCKKCGGPLATEETHASAS
jgi:hypothetical protein